MGSVLIELLPLIIGSMLMPTWILLVLSLLQSRHGRMGAIAFVGGVTAVRLLQILFFSFCISVAGVLHRPGKTQTIVSTLLVVAGILLWATALKQLFARDTSETLMAKWMSVISALSPVRAFGLGSLLVATSMRAWLFMLAAIGIIEQARISLIQSVIAFLFYIVGAALLLIVPILGTLWAPARFDALAAWLQSRDRAITIAVSLVIGGFFLWLGASGLIG
jgi:hypothetical protein